MQFPTNVNTEHQRRWIKRITRPLASHPFSIRMHIAYVSTCETAYYSGASRHITICMVNNHSVVRAPVHVFT